ncbi:HARB1 nuclease, partial [Polyodon spathula]|nr:HARB1 nuclease [Polyodon spathula]
MAAPLLRDSIDQGAILIRLAFRRVRVLRDRHTTRSSRALTVTQSICIGLRSFASGTFLYSVGDAENIGKAAAYRAVRRVYLSIKIFLHVFITFPGHTRENIIKEGFYAVAGNLLEFPKVIGAVDCSQIPIKAPSGPNEADFVNRKSFHSINIQVLMTLSLT